MLIFLPQKRGAEIRRNLSEVMDVFITLTVVMVSRVYGYSQTHRSVYIKYVQYFIYQLYLI